jgi:phosphoenolpyruvate carboxykinase (ATP)
VVENVTIDPLTRVPNYDDESVTENTRAAYPVEFIPDCIEAGVGGHPDNVVFLSYDAFGVLPPVARLTPEQAMYHFLSGYTSKTAGTEVGMGSEPIPEFSACFGHPFLPRPPRVYADMLGEKLARHGSTCWLINTGLTGGAFGVGHRMKISLTRAIVEGIVSGVLNGVAFTPDPVFGLWVPSTCPGVSAEVLMPRNTWRDKKAYDHTAEHLAREFRKNIAHLDGVTQSIIDMGGPLGGK